LRPIAAGKIANKVSTMSGACNSPRSPLLNSGYERVKVIMIFFFKKKK
jgi:hypothetical protein